MDNLVFEESITTETDQSEFTEKKWVYVNDNNSQNYSSQVVIDSTPLSNAGGVRELGRGVHPYASCYRSDCRKWFGRCGCS